MKKKTKRLSRPRTPPPVSIPIQVNPSDADSLRVQYARVSLPLAKGVLQGTPAVEIHAADGRPVPVQSELLTRWPDGSPRVLHATFAASGGVYEAVVGAGRTSPPSQPQITCKILPDNTIHIATGRLVAILGGPGIVKSIRLADKEFIGSRGIDVCVTDGRGQVYRATAAQDVRAVVETGGPLRTVIALRGKCSGEEGTFLDFRLRFEFLAGVEGFSLAYSFFNLEKGRDFFDVRSIDLDLALAGAAAPRHTVYQCSYGLFTTEGRMVNTAEPLQIAVDDVKSSAYVRNYAALGDTHDYPFYLNPPSDKVDNWAVVSDGKRALQVEMDDFHLLRPKSLDVEGDTARFGIWPAWAGILPLQQGRSRQVTVRVSLSDTGAPTARKAALAATAQLRDVQRAQLPQAAYAAANFFDQARVLPNRPDLNPRFEQWLVTMSAGLNTIATFFDLGDTPDSGYQGTYIPIGNRIRRIRGEDGGRRYFSASLHYPATKHNGLNDFEVVWVNNEYDVIFALGTECLRKNDLSLFRKLGWWARHNIDVDFLHYSDHKWLNRATPAHCERHTTTGAYPSHFWTQGLAQYYMLTADPDALEVIVALADKTIENLDDPELGPLHAGLNREVGWGILTMICAYEASGLKRFDDYARELIDREIRCGLPNDIPYFSFGHTSILLGAREYLQIHAGEAAAAPVRKWFLQFVDLAIACCRNPPAPSASQLKDRKDPGYSYGAEMKLKGAFHAAQPRSGIFGTHSIALDPIAYAYELTGDRKYIKAGMRSIEYLMDSAAFLSPVHEGKPFAMVYRTFVNFLKAASDIGLLKSFGYRY